LTGNATLSTAGAFTPSSWGYTYAVDGNLVFAAQGWNWSPWWQGSSQTTYLMGFKLNGASATPSYLGSVNGYILNQYSLSVFEGHLRVAATVDTFWPVWEPFVDSSNLTIPPQPVSRTNNTVHVLKIPTGNETVLTPVTGIPNLGKPDERFTADRFFGNICYVGTLSVSNSLFSIQTSPVLIPCTLQI
jgi:DNA excision repair protein ERCC-4